MLKPVCDHQGHPILCNGYLYTYIPGGGGTILDKWFVRMESPPPYTQFEVVEEHTLHDASYTRSGNVVTATLSGPGAVFDVDAWCILSDPNKTRITVAIDTEVSTGGEDDFLAPVVASADPLIYDPSFIAGETGTFSSPAQSPGNLLGVSSSRGSVYGGESWSDSGSGMAPYFRYRINLYAATGIGQGLTVIVKFTFSEHT